MGKIDEMRRLREQQAADRTNKRQAAAVGATGTDDAIVVVPVDQPMPPTQPTKRSSSFAKEEKKPTLTKSGDAVDERGKCSECGKMKPLSNGVLANHQKGFGKPCAGSRKPPL